MDHKVVTPSETCVRGGSNTDANGDIPSGVQVSIPAFSSAQPRQQVLGVFLPGAGFIMIVTVPVTLVG